MNEGDVPHPPYKGNDGWGAFRKVVRNFLAKMREYQKLFAPVERKDDTPSGQRDEEEASLRGGSGAAASLGKGNEVKAAGPKENDKEQSTLKGGSGAAALRPAFAAVLLSAVAFCPEMA